MTLRCACGQLATLYVLSASKPIACTCAACRVVAPAPFTITRRIS